MSKVTVRHRGPVLIERQGDQVIVSSLTDDASLRRMAKIKSVDVERLALGCQVSIVINPDGSYQASCENEGCNDECELYDSGGDPREVFCFCPGPA